MKITSLIENSCFKLGLVAEHGLSFLIEIGESKLLFDTGAGNNFISNGNILGINFATINFLVLSHGHYDHSGGLIHFLNQNKNASICLKKEIFNPKFSGDIDVGIDSNIDKGNNRFSFIDKPIEILPSLFIMPDIQIYYPDDCSFENFSTSINQIKVDDHFLDELFLCYIHNKKITIISSCSHNGITNIVQTAINYFNMPVERVIGGFHIFKSTDERTRFISNIFNKTGINEIYSCHCTGIEQFAKLTQYCNASVNYFKTGDQLVIQ